MSYAQIHPNWDRDPEYITEGFSIEMTAKDIEGLREAAPRLPRDTPIAVTFLPGETLDARLAAAREVRRLGFEPFLGPPYQVRRRFQGNGEENGGRSRHQALFRHCRRSTQRRRALHGIIHVD